jgi:cellulose synthase/poly-beta-1,6-N-acetylglucosamine synthase-like glycosyltransferase
MPRRIRSEPVPDSGARPAPESTAVVICTYTLDRWPDLVAAVESVIEQSRGSTEVLVVADHNDELRRRAAEAWPGLRVLANDGPRGLSGARNAGVAAAAADIVAFLDDDARADPGWLEELVRPFVDARVVATGGVAEAAWDAGRPAWFPREFDWVVGCSYTGLPIVPAVIRNPLGCAMAFRRSAILEAGGFRTGIGRLGRFPVGGEETELCIRIRQAHPAGLIVHVPTARVRHRVPAGRSTWRYFRERCYQEGRSKAHIATLVGAGPALASERRYTFRALPAGVLAGVRDALGGDVSGLERSLAIAAGLALTTGGYVAGRVGLDAIAAPAGAAD